MFKKTVETLVGSAIGLIAAYVIGAMSFKIGQDLKEIEHSYALKGETKALPDSQPKKYSLLKKGSVIKPIIEGYSLNISITKNK